MTSLRHIIFILLIGSAVIASAQKGLDAPMTKAVMNVYKQLLAEDPSDYETYYRRACEYYKHNQYRLALNDINNAIKYVPEDMSNIRIDQLTLRANIYLQLDSLDNALFDLKQAYALDPYSYLTLYQKANLEYQLGNYDSAKSDYTRMQRLNNRSTEALIGLARIAVKENNLGLANDYINEAVAITPSDANIYVRRASVKMMMNNANGAVDDLILAISTDNSCTKALHELVKLGNSNYSAVMTGLSNAIRQAPKVGMFYYIRAVIAEYHFNYLAAISDYQKILKDNLYNYYGIYASLADCYYALGKYDEALDNINFAITGSSKVKSYYVTKAKILRAMNNGDEAIINADKALVLDMNYNEALRVKALALSDNNKYDESTALLGEIFLNDSKDNFSLIMRGWILERDKTQAIYAKNFYQRAIETETEIENDNINSLKGFAHLALGNSNEAINWIESIISQTTQHDGKEYYYATCIYSWAGNYNKALEYMAKALDSGYAHYHNWIKCNDANINVAPLRDNPQFKELINKYSIIFDTEIYSH